LQPSLSFSRGSSCSSGWREGDKAFYILEITNRGSRMLSLSLSLLLSSTMASTEASEATTMAHGEDQSQLKIPEDHLPDASSAVKLLSDAKLMKSWQEAGGRALILKQLLPLLVKADASSKTAYLKTLKPDLLANEDAWLIELLKRLSREGLSEAASELRSGEANLQNIIELSQQLLKGQYKGEWLVLRRALSGTADPEEYNDLISALIGNGDPERTRLASHLFIEMDTRESFAALSLEDDLAYCNNEPETIYRDYLKAQSATAIKAYNAYLMASAAGDSKAKDHLQAALVLAPKCLPLQLENVLSSSGDARDKNLRHLSAELPKDDELLWWLLLQFDKHHVVIPADILLTWQKEMKFLVWIQTRCIRQKMDASVLLKRLEEPSHLKAGLLIHQNDLPAAKAMLLDLTKKEIKNGAEYTAEDDPRLAIFLLCQLGEPRPDVKTWDAILQAAFAGEDHQPLANKSDHEEMIHRLGQACACLRQGKILEAKIIVQDLENRWECGDSWIDAVHALVNHAESSQKH
jgi:hypothetical protein